MQSILLPARGLRSADRIANAIAHCGYPCPCGYHGDPVKEHTRSLTQVLRYQTLAPPARAGERISGPLLDRIDIHIDVPRVDYEKLAGDRLGEPSAQIQARVERARTAAAAVSGDAAVVQYVSVGVTLTALRSVQCKVSMQSLP